MPVQPWHALQRSSQRFYKLLMIELTSNKDRKEHYTHGDGYGHVAVVVDDVASRHTAITAAGYAPQAIKEFKRGDELLARFIFIQDPDGYKVEILERHGHYR